MENDPEEKYVIHLKANDEEQVKDFLFRIASPPHSEILSQSLLIFGFSSFDAFLGRLLKQFYREEPKLVFNAEEKTVKVGDLMKCTNLDEVIDNHIERDISSLLRKSYNDIFSSLASRHGVSTLKKFENWPKFIEASQRRNLVTHCNAVVNQQYMDVCTESGVELPLDVILGETVPVTSKYLRLCLDVLYEVGIKLAHTLWRTASPSRIEESEICLTNETFELLTREEWELAKIIGEFAINIPKPVRDLQIRISRINYAQALKWSGDDDGANKVLDSIDWSSSIRDLRLGVEVLRENFDEAAKLMVEIGKKGELVLQSGYEQWPVFRECRNTEQFKSTFREVYGIEYTAVDKNDPNDLNVQHGCSETPTLNNQHQTPETSGESQMPAEQPIEDNTPEKQDKSGTNAKRG